MENSPIKESNPEMWRPYNVYLIWPDTEEERITVTAISRNDAHEPAEIKRAIAAGAYVYKITGPLGHPRTAKQQLATQYNFLIGNLVGIEKQIQRVNVMNILQLSDIKLLDRAARDKAQAIQNIAKVKRDLADLFRRLGINIK